MPNFRDACLGVTVATLMCSATTGAQNSSPVDLLDKAQDAVVRYIDKLAEVHCTEDVEQVKVRPNGRSETSVRTQYDYFVLLQGNSIDFQLAESRLAIGKPSQKQPPLLLSNGFSMLLLIFHPYYRGAFTFTPEAEETASGRRAERYHFAHIAGTRTPAALALGSREYPLELQGLAWIDAETGQPLRIEAELTQPMTDIGLRSLRAHAEYAPAAGIAGNPVLAAVADVDLETMRQHWRNSHVFRNYKLFSTDATQSPDVKVHVSASDTPGKSTPHSTEEKP